MKMIALKEIRDINKEYGGSPLNEAEMQTAIDMGKTAYKLIAYLWRAMLAGHAYSDANKRTTYVVTRTILERNGMAIDDECKIRMEKQMLKVASRPITDVKRIERMVKYAAEGH
ncbi:MAG: hypothetical protein FJY76_00065 [Candidatus Aenigmarchaeota archaeon]|nr:hypothetical protein [Candidatus Aenigmarchaeota archaeon]